MQLTDNHDENPCNGTLFERLGDAAECFAVLTFIIPDMPIIYSGQEAGLDKRLSFFEKYNIEWEQYKFFELYKSLTELKKSNMVLHCGISGGELKVITNSNQSNILSLIRVKYKKKFLPYIIFRTLLLKFYQRIFRFQILTLILLQCKS